MDEPDWQQAMLLSWNAHPEWYQHYEQTGAGPVEQLLRDAGIDLASAPVAVHFIGNGQPRRMQSKVRYRPKADIPLTPELKCAGEQSAHVR
jgi:hypothetical protein